MNRLPVPPSRFYRLFGRIWWIALVVLVGLDPSVRAQAHRIGAAAPGLLEVGAPLFTIRSANELGLSTPPTDIQMMPDGRILVYAPGQMALGDGTRWEVFQQSADEARTSCEAVAVDRDGSIYTGMKAGFSRVEFQENGRWRLQLVTPWTANAETKAPVLQNIIQAGDDWYWHGGSGSLVSWRPGATPKVFGRAQVVEHVFRLGDATFLSDSTSGQLWRLTGETMEPVSFLPNISVNETITCAVPFGQGRLLVGTYGHGLWVFDGEQAKPFTRAGPLSAEVRVNAICETAGGFFAAAIENLGVVFFDAQGRVVQVLDRALDHRLMHVSMLRSAPGGVLWGLLGDGILSIEFPSRLSYYEPLVGTGVSNMQPYRLDGRLWMEIDGKVRRARYDDSGRLNGFVVDTPPERFVASLKVVGDRLIAGTNRGAYFRGPDGWVPFAESSVNLRLLEPNPIGGRWLYSAQGVVGWLRPTAEGFELTRTEVPLLENPFNAETDADGSVWIEIGNGRVAHLRFQNDQPEVEFFGSNEGLAQGWVQVFNFEGRVGFNVNRQILRFDPAKRRFEPDKNFARLFPSLHDVVGRPSCDAAGRFWVADDSGIHVFKKTAGTWRDLYEKMPPGLLPYLYCPEDGGVVWMHDAHRLVRYDPAMPDVPPVPLRAMITRVEFPLTGRSLMTPGGALPALDFADNSLVAHFGALGSPFGGSVAFEVRLDGSDNQWVDAGSGGSAGFNRLKEGRYVLHVRPRTSEITGSEATMSFEVRPPWFRAPAAYAAYVFGSLAMIVSVAWLASFIQRRENARLELLVTQRTRELLATNDQLARQVEEIRRLSQAVEQSPSGIALTAPDGDIVFANPHFCGIYGYSLNELIGRNLRSLLAEPWGAQREAKIAGALAARESWHGQVTNRTKDGRTIRVRVTLAAIRSPDGAIRNHLALHENITEWLAEQERRRRLESQLLQAQKLDALGTLAGGIAHDFNNILTGILGYCELAKQVAGENFELQDDLEGIRNAGLRAKDLVARILTFTRQGTAQLVPLDLASVVSEAVKLLRASTPATVEIAVDLRPGVIYADSTQIQQIVINLGTNAVHALCDRPGRIGIVVQPVRVDESLAAELNDLAPGDWVRLTVSDNGHGMDEATIDRIFEPFFTTKKPGQGTGLGLAIVRAIVTSHHGAVRVQSAPGAGTTFELYFPQSPEKPASTVNASPVPGGANREILVVDDEPSVGNFVALRLQKFGYRPAVFNDPRAALAAFELAPSRFAAIVTDLTMPHMTGAELLDRIRACGRPVPAVIISGYSEDLMHLRSATVACCAVLQKPFTGEELGHALDQVIREDETG